MTQKKINKGLRDVPKTSVPTDAYRNGWDTVFGRKVEPAKSESEGKPVEDA